MVNRKRSATVIALVAVAILSIGSLAYASHSLRDVPEDHTFHNDIDWMEDTGITRGCNPPANDEYCPEDFVTRGQMAAFFNRAASSRAFDAGTLDGSDSSEFVKKGEKVGDADTLDGNDSTDFVKQGEKVGDADTLDGKDSTDFVEEGDPVGDADTLDGKDSSEFLSSSVTVREDEENFLVGVNSEVTANCESDEVVIGGGYESEGLLAINVNDNHPTDDGWRVAGTATVAATVTAYAICASAG